VVNRRELGRCEKEKKKKKKKKEKEKENASKRMQAQRTVQLKWYIRLTGESRFKNIRRGKGEPAKRRWGIEKTQGTMVCYQERMTKKTNGPVSHWREMHIRTPLKKAPPIT